MIFCVVLEARMEQGVGGTVGMDKCAQKPSAERSMDHGITELLALEGAS